MSRSILEYNATGTGHTYKRHGSPWRAAPESDIAYTQQQGHIHLATLQQWPGYGDRPTGCGYNPKRGRPGTGRRASEGPAGGRASSGGGGGGSGSGGSSRRRLAGKQRARQPGRARVQAALATTRVSNGTPGGGAGPGEANSRQVTASGDDGNAGTNTGHGGPKRPRPQGAQDERCAVPTRHAREQCLPRALKTSTRAASTVG